MSKRSGQGSKGSKKPKANKFDPAMAKAKGEKFAHLKDELGSAYQRFIQAAMNVIGCGEQCYEIITSVQQSINEHKANGDVASLCMVAFLGLKGIDVLRMAQQLVPISFANTRQKYITRIVNSILDEEALLSSNYDALMKICLAIPTFFKQKPTVDGYISELQKISLSTGKAHTAFIAPPVSTCIQSSCLLQNVPVFDVTGPIPGVKVSLRCRECSTNYNYNYYGNRSSKMNYAWNSELIELSDVAYATQNLHKWFTALSVHSWVSFSGFAEAYFHWTSIDEYTIKLWLHKEYVSNLTRQYVSDMFYYGELSDELKHEQWIVDDREEVIQKVVTSLSIYSHTCNEGCEQKGCGKCWSVDGNWKINFPHCMFPMKVSVPTLPLINMPDVCCNQPINSEIAFCKSHYELAIKKGYPTKVREFVKYCDIETTNVPIEESNSESGSLTGILSMNPDMVAILDDTPAHHITKCSKDLGTHTRLRHWSRGHVFICRPCGHIDFWQPIYRSESPSQVFLIVLQWLYETLQAIPVDKWSEVVLAYDAMCKLDGLKVCSLPLPLAKPFDNMWMAITKVIDSFHFKNHTDQNCISKYNPEVIHQQNPNYNFMCCEQTFVWLSRYKKILCSMSKNHHLFYLHRMITHRNRYTETCHRTGRKPLLPKAKQK